MDLSQGKRIEELRIVMLVHRLQDSRLPPVTQLAQRSKHLHDQVPTNLDALQDLPVTDTPSQHDDERLTQMLGVPGHLHASGHPLRLLHALTETMVVPQIQVSIGLHTFDRRGINQEACTVPAKELNVLRRGVRTSGRARQRLLTLPCWASPRIHTLTDTVLPQGTHLLVELPNGLRERDDILPELVQARVLYRQEVHLDVFQRQEHGLGQSALSKEPCQLLMRKLPAGIHVIQMREPGSHDSILASSASPLLQDIKMTASARASDLLGQRSRSRVLLRSSVGPTQRGHLIHGMNGNVTVSQASLLLLQEIQLQPWNRVRPEGRVERRELLTANLARKEKHIRQNFMLHAYSQEASLTQHHVVLRHAPGDSASLDKHHLLRKGLAEAQRLSWRDLRGLCDVPQQLASEPRIPHSTDKAMRHTRHSRNSSRSSSTGQTELHSFASHVGRPRILLTARVEVYDHTIVLAFRAHNNLSHDSTAEKRRRTLATGDALETWNQKPYTVGRPQILGLRRQVSQQGFIVIHVITRHRDPPGSNATRLGLHVHAFLQHPAGEKALVSPNPTNVTSKSSRTETRVDVGEHLLRPAC